MTPATRGTNEDQLRALLDERVQAAHDRDARALTSACAPDIVSFDALPPLRRLSAGVWTTARSATRCAICASSPVRTRFLPPS
jgi:hypothetical protein